MIEKIINKVKGWWKSMFDYNKVITEFGLDSETSKEMLDAIKLWSDIFNGNAPWENENVKSLHVAKTVCEKVSVAVTIELKTSCSEKYIDNVYQRFIRNIRKYAEYGMAKGSMFFKPIYENGKIKISVIQGDKFIPFKFDDTGELLGCIIIDQITEGNKVYTRLEYNELKGKTIFIKNIAYEGKANGVILEKKIDLHSVDKWKEVEYESAIDNVEHLIGGFFTMKNANTIDNNSPLGVSIFNNAIGTLEEIDKQFSRTLWEYEGSELAIDIDENYLSLDKNTKKYKFPKGKERLYRKLSFDTEESKKWNVFSPEIRDTSLFNGLNELLRQAESEMNISFGVLSKMDQVALTATEIKSSKQDYYVTVSDIQTSLQSALEDLIYGIYVLCKLYGIPVSPNYETMFDWDDSILVDKETIQKQSQLELSQGIIDRVAYFMTTRDWSEEEAIEYIKKMNERKKILEPIEEEEEPEM